jgi:hypothetical protein
LSYAPSTFVLFFISYEGTANRSVVCFHEWASIIEKRNGKPGIKNGLVRFMITK